MVKLTRAAMHYSVSGGQTHCRNHAGLSTNRNCETYRKVGTSRDWKTFCGSWCSRAAYAVLGFFSIVGLQSAAAGGENVGAQLLLQCMYKSRYIPVLRPPSKTIDGYPGC